MTVAELREQLATMPDDLEVYIEDECCACCNTADDVMLVDDRQLASSIYPEPVVVITG